MRVLIIDDNQDLREVFKAYAEYVSDEIDVLESGLDALTFLEENPVDAVIVDLAMPVFDGLSVVQEIRRNEQMHPNDKPARLAFYTGHVIDSVVQEIINECKVERVFFKPLDPAGLMQDIRTWLG